MMGKMALIFSNSNNEFFSRKILVLFFFLLSLSFLTNSINYSYFLSLSSSTLYSQVRPKQVLSKKVLKNQQKNKLNLLNYAKRAENRGDNRSAFQYYRRLLKIDDSDFEVIEGFVRTSISTDKIKQCQAKLSEILDKYYKKNENTNKHIVLDNTGYYKLISQVAYFYIATNREQTAEQYLSKISTSKEIDSNTKAILISSIYEKTGNFEYASKILIDARIDKNDLAFSKQLYGLYFKNLDFKKSSSELLNYFLGSDFDYHNNSLKKNNNGKGRFEKKYIEVETGFIKIFESITDSEVKKEILENITYKQSDLNAIIERIYSNVKDEDSLETISVRLDNQLNNILFSLYFKDKNYSKAYEYFSLKSNNINSAIKFAKQLYNEREYDLAYSYYLKILNDDELLNSSNSTTNNKSKDNSKKHRNLKDVYDTFLIILTKLKKSDESIDLLEKIIHESNKEKFSFLNRDDVYLKLAEVYQYELFDFAKAEKVYLEKLGIKNKVIKKSKKRYKSSKTHLKASINYYELLIISGNKVEADKISDYIENNSIFHRIDRENERYHYLFTVSSILVDDDYKLFFKRVEEFVKKNLDSNYSNDLLFLSFELRKILPELKMDKLEKNSIPNITKDLIELYLKNSLIDDYQNIDELDYKQFKDLKVKVFVIKLKYNYLQSSNKLKELDLLVKDLLSEKIFQNNEEKTNYFFDEILLNYVIFITENNIDADNSKKTKKEVLNYFLNNYSSSVLYDEARKLLREI